MTQGATVAEAAARFNVSPDTVRRWVRLGCPAIRPGEVGRTRGAVLDLDAVARWRASRAGVDSIPNDLMERIETALLDVLRRDGGNGWPVTHDLGIEHSLATELLTHALRRIRRALEGGG
jgi:Helix-turn-helix domain